MNIVVNDANVLIDLVKLRLLPHFFGLQLVFYTTDLILNELHDNQIAELQPFIDAGTLCLIHLSEEELQETVLMRTEKSQLSEQDCSAIVCARKVSGSLLTSDNTLRKFASRKLLTVYGHLWLFDRMVKEKTISAAEAILKLAELCDTVNPRLGLPKAECDRRVALWELL